MDDLPDIDLSSGVPVGLVLRIVGALLEGWDDKDVHRYFRMAYRDRQMAFVVDTNNDKAAQFIAEGVAERMRQLRAADDKRRLSG